MLLGLPRANPREDPEGSGIGSSVFGAGGNDHNRAGAGRLLPEAVNGTRSGARPPTTPRR